MIRKSSLVLVALAAFGAISATTVAKKPPKPVVKKIDVKDDVYAPMKLKVKVGTKLNWVWDANNYDSHNVRLQKGPKGVKKSKFESPDGTIGIKWARTLTVPGSYEFICTLHPDSMYMSVVVTKH